MFRANNHITLVGYLGDNPKLITLPNGSSLAEFQLATTNNYVRKSGEKVSKTEWHTIKAFGKVADILERYLTKGSHFMMVGYLQYSEWKDSDDRQHRRAEIIVEAFQFLDRGNRHQGNVATPMAKETAGDTTLKKPEESDRPAEEICPF